MPSQLRLRWSKFGLTHHRPASFGTAQWQKRETVSVPYLLYRLLVFCFFWGFFVALIVTSTPDVRPYLMIYLTVWTYMTAMLDVALQLAASCTVAFRHHYGIKPVCPPLLYKTHWVIVNISHTMEPFVTILYWSTVFPQLSVAVNYTDLHLHLFTTIYAIMDLLIHGSPRRYHHVLYPLSFALTYLFFTIIYYFCGGVGPDGSTAIYPILDWAKPGLTIGVAVGAVLVIFILHGVTWGLVKLRQKMHGRWHGDKSAEVVMVESPEVTQDGGENGNGMKRDESGEGVGKEEDSGKGGTDRTEGVLEQEEGNVQTRENDAEKGQSDDVKKAREGFENTGCDVDNE
ncbi:protein rolling stone-like [Amphibalanus amphitrite]|uniref:protein rolling stone-like n=1 Tax=Amphibalanus amphitrite TaxID=1232801 RepID=UPI001C91F05D|nr:protein rolling stone-like [Amphibalanus amphitrite]